MKQLGLGWNDISSERANGKPGGRGLEDCPSSSSYSRIHGQLEPLERETDRDRERETGTETERETERQRETETETERERETERDRERERERHFYTVKYAQCLMRSCSPTRSVCLPPEVNWLLELAAN